MTTTHLFVELLVIGFGALLFALLLAAAAIGYEPQEVIHALDRMFAGYALLPLLPVVYVLGILADRVADRVVDRIDKKHRSEVFEDRESYYHARRTLVEDAPNLWEHLEYLRSRLRICRGWALNSALLLIAGGLYVLRMMGQPKVQLAWAAVGCLAAFFAAIFGLCTWSWWRMNVSEYKKIERQAKWVRRGQHGKT